LQHLHANNESQSVKTREVFAGVQLPAFRAPYLQLSRPADGVAAGMAVPFGSFLAFGPWVTWLYDPLGL
jgi:hypothetical protein